MNILMLISNMLISAGPFSGLTDNKLIINFLLLIDSKIYSLFAYLYGLYIQLASARIFDVSSFDFFVKNVYVLFGVVALFILAFFILQSIINPEDSKGNKSMQEFVKRIAMTIFLTCITPLLFDFLYDFQESLLKYQVIPKTVLGEDFSMEQTGTVYYQNENGELICEDGVTIYDEASANCTPMTTTQTVDVGEALLNSDGYGIAYYVFSGFMHPKGNVTDVEVDASEYFNAETGFWATWGGCAVGVGGTLIAAGITALVTYFTGGTATGFAGALTTKTGSVAVTACAAAAATGYTINAIGEAVTSEEFKWSDCTAEMRFAGSFDNVPAFDEAVVDGTMEYTPIASTVAGVLLVYLIFSFCLDLGVRAAKLILYQIMAPISFLVSAIPSKKDLMSKWFKAVFTTWAEIYIRIFTVCGVALLVRELNFNNLSGMGLLAQAVIILGLVTFAKQFPKLLSDLIGVESGNMKLGIREKLAAGGAFTAGAIVGGGVTALTRNAMNKWVNKENWKNKDGKVTAGSIAKNLFSGAGSALGGGVSGAFRSGKSGIGAKSFKDMKSSASSGAKEAVSARDRRATYKANHGGTLGGVVEGRVKDAIRGAGEWAGIGVVTSTESDWFTSGANAFDSAHSQMESAYKGKPEHNRIKEKITELNSESRSLSEKIAKFDIMGSLTEEQSREVDELRKKLEVVKEELESTNAFKSQHEAKEMAKKMSLQMEAINGLVNAKMKYFDISSSIFSGDKGKELYSLIKDIDGKTDSESVKNIISKIQQNQTITLQDLQDAKGNALIDMKSLETFADRVGIEAKNMAAEKRVAVSHAKALKEEKKSDGK